MTTPRFNYHALPNGLISARDTHSGLQGVLNADGSPRHGDAARAASREYLRLKAVA